jgi:hypothetical protein
VTLLEEIHTLRSTSVSDPEYYRQIDRLLRLAAQELQRRSRGVDFIVRMEAAGCFIPKRDE